MYIDSREILGIKRLQTEEKGESRIRQRETLIFDTRYRGLPKPAVGGHGNTASVVVR